MGSSPIRPTVPQHRVLSITDSAFADYVFVFLRCHAPQSTLQAALRTRSRQLARSTGEHKRDHPCPLCGRPPSATPEVMALFATPRSWRLLVTMTSSWPDFRRPFAGPGRRDSDEQKELVAADLSSRRARMQMIFMSRTQEWFSRELSGRHSPSALPDVHGSELGSRSSHPRTPAAARFRSQWQRRRPLPLRSRRRIQRLLRAEFGR